MDGHYASSFLLKTVKLLAASLIFSMLLLPSVAHGLPALRSYTNSGTGDVFLGGEYIEVGISKYGSFGTTSGQPLPSGFFGTAARTNIGMSTNPSGFGVLPDQRMDFFLPGTPEERWVVGYKIAGAPTTASNGMLVSQTGIANNVVTDESTPTLAKAKSIGTLNSNLEITQLVSFKVNDKLFKNEVTLKNVGAQNLDSVRYMRSFDPDNTVDKGGSYSTFNKIVYTHAAGDGKAVVVADTSANASDPVFLNGGSRSPIMFFSLDTRARASSFGFGNGNPYDASAYDSALAKDSTLSADRAITMTFDVGTLAPGASEKVVYYTVLDSGDVTTVLEAVQNQVTDDGDNVLPAVEDAAPNAGDANGDGTIDSLQPHVSSIPNPEAGGEYLALETTGCDAITNIEVKAESALGADTYTYPLGLTDFTLSCTTPGGTANVTMYFDKVYNTSSWKARKFINGTFSDVAGVVFGTATVGGTQVTTMQYSLVDGGPLDSDGLANGTIVDPIGPAVLGATSPAVTAPNTGLQHRSLVSFYAAVVVGVSLAYAGYKKFAFAKTSKR